MVNISALFVPVTVSVTVIAVVVFDVTEADVIFLLAVKVDVTLAAVLKFHPAGAFSINVTFAPIAKSPFAPSVTTIFPSVVNDGELAFAALSAEIVPPVAVVIVAVAFAACVKVNEIPLNKISRKKFFRHISPAIIRAFVIFILKKDYKK